MATGAEEQYLLGVDAKLRKAAEASNKGVQADSTLSNLRRAKIITANADGTYNVGMLGSNGSVVSTIDGIRPFGSSATLAVDAQVLLFWEGSQPMPWIFVGGGGGSGLSAVGCFAEFVA